MNIPSIHLRDISKKYHRHLLYKNLSLNILPQDKLVVLGNNGSGKSTLLKIMIGLVSPTSGEVVYQLQGQTVDKTRWHQYISVAAPYMSMMETLTLDELVRHVYTFRPFQMEPEAFLEALQLNAHRHKPIKQFSSGMKQKTRLLLAIADAAPVLFLDEPATNLDARTVQWYADMVQKWAFQKTMIVFSNEHTDEYFFCNKQIRLDNQ